MGETIVKKCPFCGKEVQNLGQHIANIHPSVLKKLDETAETEQKNISVLPSVQSPPPLKTIQELLREKIELIMDLKILEMLSNSPDASLKDLSKMLNPVPEKTALEQLKEFKEISEMFTKEVKTEGSDWSDVAIHSLPIVKELINNRGKQNENRKWNENTERTNRGTIRRIARENTRDTRQPKDYSRESGRTSDVSKQPSKSN